MLIQSKGNTLKDQIAAGKVDARGRPITPAGEGSSQLSAPAAQPLATATQPAATPAPVTPNSPQAPATTSAQTSTTASGTPGSYKNVPITPGTDAEIQAQIARIDAQQADKGNITINQQDTSTPTQTQTPSTPPEAPQAPPEAPQAPPAAAPADPYANLEQNASDAQKQLDATYNDYQTKAAQVSKAITNIQNGIIPLNDGEQAQVAGLQQSYQTLIEQQQLQNTGAAGAATVRGYQTGAAEYDPTFSIKTIGNIVSAGNAKVADLNTQMASAVASLTQGFKDSDIAAVKDSWAVYQDAADKRTTALQKTIDDANQSIKDAQDAQQKVQDDIEGIAKEAAKNGADAATISAISSASDPTTAIQMAGGYLQEATGELGDFLATNRYLASQGLSQMTLAQYQAQADARKEAVAAASRAPAGEKPATAAQQTYANYAPRLETADSLISSITPTISSHSPEWFLAQEALPAIVQNNDVKSYNQAKTNFINAVLRQESGAAIADSERASYDQQYFPQPGDPPGLIAQKAQNRAQVVASYKQAAGPAYVAPIGMVAADGEKAAQTIIQNAIDENPVNEQVIDGRIHAMEAELGRPVTSTEFLQAFPEYNN